MCYGQVRVRVWVGEADDVVGQVEVWAQDPLVQLYPCCGNVIVIFWVPC